MSIKSILILILGMFLFFWMLIKFGEGEVVDQYAPYVIGALILGLFGPKLLSRFH